MSNINIYKKCSFLILFFTVSSLYSQDDGGSPGQPSLNITSEINNSIKFPKSPEADAFEKYGNMNVNLYSGTPDINLPLHTIKGRELDIPMSLNYDASGVKVSQIATVAGLNWSLNFGGRISRITNGMPDDLALGPYNHKDEILGVMSGIDGIGFESYKTLMEQITQGYIDTQLDLYSLNVLGINDYIIRDLETNEYYTLNNPRIHVEINNNNWIITGEDGAEYYFENVYEKTEISGGTDIPGGGNVYNGTSTTSWLLSKIKSKNKLDQYDFNYQRYDWNSLMGMQLSAKIYRETLLCPIYLGQTNSWDSNTSYKTSQKTPFKIYHNSELVIEFKYKSRQDLSFIAPTYQGGNAIDEILFYKFKTNESNPIYHKKIVFDHGYFGNENSSIPSDKRLMLKSFTSYQSNISEGKKYSFEYNSPNDVRPTTSFAQDFLGLYNGHNGNSSLVPRMKYWVNNWTIGAYREPAFESAIIGTLNKITYPTKGYTTFEFEQNIVTDSENTIVTYVPGHYLCDDTTFFTSEPEYYCNENNQFTQFSQNMLSVNSSNFGHSYDSVNYTGVLTQLVTIPEDGNYELEVNGNYSIFIIQKLPDCNDLIPEVCDDENNSINHFSCMKPTNTIFMRSPTNYSYPNDYVMGGMVTGPNMMGEQAIDGIKHFTPGKYQFTTWSSGQPESEGFHPFATVRVSRCVPNSTYVEPYSTTSYSHTSKIAEGFRIKYIKDFSKDGAIAHEKEYQYIKDYDSNYASGILLGERPEPKRTTAYYKACVSLLTPNGECKNLESMCVTSGGITQNPNVGYSSVFEISKSDGQTNGYTQTKFNVGKSGIICEPDGIKSYQPSFKISKVSEKKVFDKYFKPKTAEKITYSDDIEFFSLRSFAFVKMNSDQYAYSNDLNSIQYISGWCYQSGENGSPEQIPGIAPPPSGFSSSHLWYSTALGKYSFSLSSQEIKGKYGYITQKETSTFTATGDEIKKIEDYAYEAYVPYRLLTKTTSTSNSAIISEDYTYHEDFPLNPEKITAISTQKGTAKTDRVNIYETIGTDANFVTEIKTAKGGNGIESRLKFDYDPTSKNIITTLTNMDSNAPNNSYVSYIFGYDDRFPVAKLVGVKYSDIPSGTITAIKDHSNVEITDANTSLLQADFNNLRAQFPNALITTYTYNPVIGVTSQTDPKGYTTYYEYDELSRLKIVRDGEGNIITENEYHYRAN